MEVTMEAALGLLWLAGGLLAGLVVLSAVIVNKREGDE